MGILPAEESGGIVEIGAKKAQAVDELEIVAAFLFSGTAFSWRILKPYTGSQSLGK